MNKVNCQPRKLNFLFIKNHLEYLVIATNDTNLDQPVRAQLYNHLRNYLTTRFDVAVRLFSNKQPLTSKYIKDKEVVLIFIFKTASVS